MCIRDRKTDGKFKFSILAESAFPGYGGMLVDITVFVGGFSSVTTYFVLIGQAAPVSLGVWYGDDGPFWISREFWIVGMALVVSVIVIVIRRMAVFELTSLYSSVFFITLSCSVFAAYVYYRFETLPPVDVDLLVVDFNLGRAIADTAFTYQSHTVLFPIYRELESPVQGVVRSITRASVLLASFMYVTTGTYGYLLFGRDVTSNVFNDFPETATYINWLRFFYTFEIMFTLPVSVNANVIHIQSVLAELTKRFPTLNVRSTEAGITRTAIAVVEVILAATIAIIVGADLKSFGYLVTVTSIVSSTMLVFVVPQVTFIVRSPLPILSSQKLKAGLIMAVGGVVIVTGFSALVADLTGG